MKKSVLAVGIILMFAINVFTPATAQNRERQSLVLSTSKWLFVGGSGPGNYTRIQDALNHANNGDTVFVYHGVYDESKININSTITLIGENRDNTILDAHQDIDGIYIRANFVNISGFKIINASRAGINLYSNTSDNVTISKNIFSHNAHGIHPYYHHKNLLISKNIFINNTNGFTLVGCTNAQIYQNVFIGNNWGMSIYLSSYCNISHNHIEASKKCGIRLYGESGFNNIHQNNFINNSVNAYFYLLTFLNIWDGNYWNEPRTAPVPIFGSVGFVLPLLINFDRHPAHDPYGVPSTY